LKDANLDPGLVLKMKKEKKSFTDAIKTKDFGWIVLAELQGRNTIRHQLLPIIHFRAVSSNFFRWQ